MICCFTCSTSNFLKPMDSFTSELSAVADYLDNEKISQDMCKTITQTVESTNVSTQIEAQPFPSLMPNLNPEDDIEGILHEISEILAAQSADTSECTDDGLNDSRSVEEILKDAEELVCSSAVNIEAEKSVSVSNKSAHRIKTSNEKVKIANSVSFAKDVKEYLEPGDKLKRSKSFTDFEKTKMLDDNTRPPDGSGFSASRPFIRNDYKKISKPMRKKSEAYELKLSDLATVYEDTDGPAESEVSDKAEDVIDNEIIISENNIDNDDKVTELKLKIDSLNLKVAQYEKKEKEKTTHEDRLGVAERTRLALLEGEVLSQEELIASYQRENQRLCSDIINAKKARSQKCGSNPGRYLIDSNRRISCKKSYV